MGTNNESNKKKVACCPNCLKKITRKNFLKKSNQYKCYICTHTFQTPTSRDKDYWEQIVGYRKVKRRMLDEQGRALAEMVVEEVPRYRRGKRTLDESRLREFSQDKLISKLKKMSESTDVLYQTSIKKLNQMQRDAALIAFMFITGARVSEIVGIRSEDGYVVEPIRKDQITRFEYQGRVIWKVESMPVLKRRNEARFDSTSLVERMIVPRRDIVIPYEFEKELIDIITRHINKFNDRDILFEMTDRNAHKILYRFYKVYPHFMRHLRATDLTVRYNMNGLQLKHFFGWTSQKMAERYAHLNTQNLLDGMIRGKEKSES